jgi:hypothetical protein
VLSDLAKEVEQARRLERQQYKAATDQVNKYFLDIMAPVSAALGLFQSLIREHQIRKAQAVYKAAAALGARPMPMRDAGRILDAQGRVAVIASAEILYRVIDEALIPRDLLKIDPVAVRTRIARLRDEGQPLEIPGLKIEEHMRTTIKSASRNESKPRPYRRWSEP